MAIRVTNKRFAMQFLSEARWNRILKGVLWEDVLLDMDCSYGKKDVVSAGTFFILREFFTIVQRIFAEGSSFFGLQLKLTW